MYRPQFVFITPPGFKDEQFTYSFDGTNTPLLSSSNPLAAGALLENIYLQFQQDAEFLCRGVNILLGTGTSTLNVQIRDSFDNPLQVTQVPIATLLTPAGQAVSGHLVVSFEPEIRIPAGGFLIVNLRNPTTGSVNPPAFTFFGVKRSQECAG